MNQAERRDIAMGAARSLIRSHGMNPATVDIKTVWAVLDDLARSEPQTIAAKWYMEASDAQEKLFVAEFKKWQRGQ